MVKQLLPGEGGELALVLEPALLELLGLDAGTPLEVRTDGVSIIVQRAGADRAARVAAAAERLMAAHDETFRKLAL